MRKYLLAAVLLVAVQGAAQSLNEVFGAFRDKPGVEFVELSGKFLLEQLKGQVMAQMQEQMLAQLSDSTVSDSARMAELHRQLEDEFAREVEKEMSGDGANGGNLAVLQSIDSIVVLHLEDCGAELLAEFEAMTANLREQGYDVLLNRNEELEHTQVLTRAVDGELRELLVRNVEDGEAQLVRVTGRFREEDWSKMLNVE